MSEYAIAQKFKLLNLVLLFSISPEQVDHQLHQASVFGKRIDSAYFSQRDE